MDRRLILQNKLEELFGSKNVYYQPPETIKMAYPAIKYSKTDIDSRFANDSAYRQLTRYEIVVIDREPDNPVINELLRLPYSSYDRYYKASNLNHDVLTLYF